MSFGSGKNGKTHDFRALPLTVGALGEAKRKEAEELRDKCLRVTREMGVAAHSPEPLQSMRDGKELVRILTPVMKVAEGLNQAYAQCCRATVVAAVGQLNKKYFSQLLGRLRHCTEEIKEADRKVDAAGLIRQYYYVPPGVTVPLEELTALSIMGMDKGDDAFDFAMALYRRVVLDNDTAGLTAGQVIVLCEIHRQVQEKHSKADFGAESTTVALPLPYMVLPTTDKDIMARIDEGIGAMLLVDANNAKYQFFIDLASSVPHGPRIRIPLVVPRNLLRHLLRDGRKEFTANSLTLELGPHGVIGVNLVVAQPKTEPIPLTQVDYILGRDFGYKNTIALSLMRLDSPIDEVQLAEIQNFTKEQAQAFLSSHATLTDPHVAATYRFSGKPFLDSINVHAAKIDKTRSRIDLEYQWLFAEKVLLAEALGLVEGADGLLPKITKDDALRGHPQFERVRSFLSRRGLINSLKITQRGLYKKIASLKKHWFGFLANIEIDIAQQWNALVVHEDLTIEAVEKESPKYKGRTFNKMINHGSCGQYARRARAKAHWAGVPMLAVPSYHTSTTCVRHALVLKSQRKGDFFSCKLCKAEGRPREHADDHAAYTLGAYLMLRPNPINVTPT